MALRESIAWRSSVPSGLACSPSLRPASCFPPAEHRASTLKTAPRRPSAIPAQALPGPLARRTPPGSSPAREEQFQPGRPASIHTLRRAYAPSLVSKGHARGAPSSLLAVHSAAGHLGARIPFQMTVAAAYPATLEGYHTAQVGRAHARPLSAFPPSNPDAPVRVYMPFTPGWLLTDKASR
jgi:hypothetical protein